MIWLWILATVTAFYIKGLCGFANTLVFGSIAGFGASNVEITPVELILGFPANCVMTWTNKEHLKKKIFLPILLMVLAGSIVGAFLLKNLDARLVKLIFGGVVMAIGLNMLRKEFQKDTRKMPRPILTLIGIASGLLCGLFGVGVLAAAYVSEITENTKEFKANLSVIFIIENIVRIITYISLGVISFATLKQVAILLPFMLGGLFAGIFSAKVLNEAIAKKLVIVLLIISGLALVLMNI